ncbi:hypothetical protein PO883_27405 [Massilia sp. DJPM01]|nr:hypothetical protein [Massilia sp. DJPM01]MDM5180913.1 hypothetical protein [Massilia sp. DJPM01]
MRRRTEHGSITLAIFPDQRKRAQIFGAADISEALFERFRAIIP